MSLAITLTDEKINALRVPQGAQQKVIQSGDALFVSVNLSVKMTLGLAILNAVAADDDLWLAFNEKEEEDLLKSITSIAFRFPAEAVTVDSYLNSGAHASIMPADELSYLPVARLWRNYVLGGATAVVLDIGTEL